MCDYFAKCTREPVVQIKMPDVMNMSPVATCEPCLAKLDRLSDGSVRDDVVAVAAGFDFDAWLLSAGHSQEVSK